MYILFFIVHLFFAYLLYLLGANFEAGAFVLLGITSVILFSPYKFFARRKSEHHDSLSETVNHVESSISHGIISFFSRQALFLSIVTTDIALMGIVYGGEAIFGINMSEFISGFVLFLNISGIVLIFMKYLQSRTIRQIVEVHVPILGFFLLLGYFLQGDVFDWWYALAFLGTTTFQGVLVYR